MMVEDVAKRSAKPHASMIIISLQASGSYPERLTIATRVDPAIGGDVAVLILEHDRPTSWFSKPAVCVE
jgi:hypothetical protein